MNSDKTEVCLFGKNDARETTVKIEHSEITVGKTMKILGIIFDRKLTWGPHIMFAVSKANKTKQALRIISHNFTREEMVELSTSLFYGSLYYGAKVWLHSGLHSVTKKKIWQASGRMLKIALKDNQRNTSFEMLHRMAGRATPEMWSNYVTANAMYNTVVNQESEELLAKFTLSNITEQRHQGILFSRTNKTKIGFNCLSNRLQKVSRRLNVKWTEMNNVQFKKHCKDIFIRSELEINHQMH